MAKVGDVSGSVVAADSDQLSASKTSSKDKKNELSKDAFIQLLVTQMRYQDPLNPMDNSEMIAQLAQFTALEQMMNVAQGSQRQLANSMVGKYVEYQYTDEATGKTSYCVGKVDYATISGETPMIGIGDVEVEISKVTQIYNNDSIQANTSVFDVIGKTVQATYTETTASGEKESSVIEGKVQGIKMIDGKPYILIGTESGSQLSIAYDSVQNIVENSGIAGRTVTANVTDEHGNKQTITGEVQYVKVTSDGTYLYINGQLVDFNDVETFK